MKEAVKIRENDTYVIVDLPEKVVKGGDDLKLKNILMKAAEKEKNVAVNMKNTTYIDSGIVIALLSTEKLVQKYGKKMYIINPSVQARDLLVITSVSNIIPIIENENQLPD